jgi:hypothetical protein
MITPRFLVGIISVMLAMIACSPIDVGQSSPSPAKTQEVTSMSGATSPSGDKHPGEVLFEDRVENRQWAKQAAELPQTMVWVLIDEVWQPVVRVEITGTVEQRHISKFGTNGAFLESTIQAPPPPQRRAEPTPTPIPNDQ